MNMIIIIFLLFIAVIVLFSKVSKLESEIEILKDELFQRKKASFYHETTIKDQNQTEKLQQNQEIIYNTIAKEENRPTLWQSLFSFDYLLVKLGAIILFFGLAFLAKYTIEHSLLSVTTRLFALTLFALAILFTGYKVKKKNRKYALIMQGLGIAILYLTIFSASKIYSLFSFQTAFILMLGVVILGSFLAIVQNSLELAIFSIGGGFLAPILTSSNSNKHILLFGYYTLLNIHLLIIAYKKAWRALNITGFLFTFIIATIWGILKYNPIFFASTEPFLLLFFAIYLMASIFYTKKYNLFPNPKIDTVLIFALPFITFVLQLELVSNIKYADALSAFGFGLIYLLLWRFLTINTLVKKAFFLIGTLFLTLSIAYIFSTKVTAAIWALEGAVVIYFAKKYKQEKLIYFGSITQFLGTFLFALSIWHQNLSWEELIGYILITASIGTSFYHLFGNNKFQKQFALLLLSLWIVWSSFNLPPSNFYLPLFNLYELSQTALFIIAIALFRKKGFEEFESTVLGILLLLFMSTVLARAFSFFGAIDYSFYSLSKNSYFQSTLTILWTLFGLGILLFSKKFQNRQLWFGGFTILIITVVKLFLFDLIHITALERIVSFVVVGILLLLVGYFVPLPQKKDKHKIF